MNRTTINFVRMFAIIASLLLSSSQLVSAQSAPSDHNAFISSVPRDGGMIGQIVHANATVWKSDPFRSFAYAVNEDGTLDTNVVWSILPQSTFDSLTIPAGIEAGKVTDGVQLWSLDTNETFPRIDQLDSRDVFEACMSTNSCDSNSLSAEVQGMVWTTPDFLGPCPSYDFGRGQVAWEYQDGDRYYSGLGSIVHPATEYGWGQYCEPVVFFGFAPKS